MNYHVIKKDDMLNGDGLRVVLFVSGCSHYCRGCQNPQTFNIKSGTEFTEKQKEEILKELSKSYVTGLTLSGGDPLHENNLHKVIDLIEAIQERYQNKTIWLYSGYKYEDLFNQNDNISNQRKNIVSRCDVFVDGEFKEELADVNYHWAGSTNQRVIDVKETLKQGKIILWKS